MMPFQLHTILNCIEIERTELKCFWWASVCKSYWEYITDLCTYMCVCVYSSQPADLCVLNVDIGVAVSMSLCSFHAGRCHNDPLLFISEGLCDTVDPAKVEWAKFRAQMSLKSSVHEPCELDTCYEWETCSGEWSQTIFTFSWLFDMV